MAKHPRAILPRCDPLLHQGVWILDAKHRTDTSDAVARVPEIPTSILGNSKCACVEISPPFPPSDRAARLTVDIRADICTRCPSIEVYVFAIFAMS
jgi:hypothetical protein